ncbi:MAG: GntR family transcriptional regulator [Clostridiales bacterium]|nr:GntR family transcriptional regulator [Clostridiales bacterium]
MGINTDSVNKQVYNLIKKDILERKIKPGERIDTKSIAEENDISVMPVRNALQKLTTNGLVINRERVGFFVRSFTEQELCEILDVRRMFELYCVQNYLANIDKRGIEALLAKIEDTQAGILLDVLDHEMHAMIINASNNEFLIKEYRKMEALFSLGLYGGSLENVNIAKGEHIAILRAILDNDVEQTTTYLRKHLERAQREVVDIYKKHP